MEFKTINISDFLCLTHDAPLRFLLDSYNNLRKLVGQEPIRMTDVVLKRNLNHLHAIKKEVQRWIWRNMLRDLIAHKVIVVGESECEYGHPPCIIIKANLNNGNVTTLKGNGKKLTYSSFTGLIESYAKHFRSDLPVRYEAPKLNLATPSETDDLERSLRRQALYRGESKPLPVRFEPREQD